MSVGDIRYNQIGLLIETTIKDQDKVVIDLSSATSKKLILESPKGIRKENDASYVTDGSDGKFKYVTQSNDLNELGVWELQFVIIKDSNTYSSSLGSFEVKRNL